MGPKLVYSLNAEETKALDRLIDTDIEEGLHPDLRDVDSDDSDDE